MSALLPLSLYIHWPFCLSKCPYCDFNSHVRDEYGEESWQNAIIAEITKIKEQLGDRVLKTIFFGGGTPSLMNPSTVSAIINSACKTWQTADDLEISLEANPNSVEVEKFKNLASAGVNRISIGVQSLIDERLKQLGRQHSSDDAKCAIEVASNYFKRFSFDLIYATPNHSVNAWKKELTEALAYQTEHLSLYQLTIEPNTPFAKLHSRGELPLPADDLAADLYELTENLCAQNGLQAYEVSNYAKPGSECRHNLTYWNYGEYVGIGPGAHGRIIIDGKRYATTQWRTPEKWLKSHNRSESVLELTPLEQYEERVMMGLRTTHGIDWHQPITAQLRNLIAEEFLILENSNLRATPKGRLALQSVLGYLLVDD